MTRLIHERDGHADTQRQTQHDDIGGACIALRAKKTIFTNGIYCAWYRVK